MRKTENKKLINSLPMQFNDSPGKIQLRLTANILKVLIDISKSAAIIADAATAQQRQSRIRKKQEGGNDKD